MVPCPGNTVTYDYIIDPTPNVNSTNDTTICSEIQAFNIISVALYLVATILGMPLMLQMPLQLG